MNYSSRRSFLAQLSALAFAAWAPARATETDGLLFAASYIKDNTPDEPSPTEGIYGFRWDADAGTLTALGRAAATASPTFLGFSPDRTHLYSVNMLNEYHGEKSGAITAFALKGSSGQLKAVNTVASGGGMPCKITVDFNGKAAFVANYGGGSVSSFQVGKNGKLSNAVSHFQYSGQGPNTARQASPHAHCTTVSRDNRFVLVNDLGLDRICVYHLDPATAQLTPNDPPYYEALPGSGPRSFAFHPTGKWAYSLNEMANTVDVLAWDAQKGMLTRLQNISTLTEGFSGKSTAATVAVDAEGRFVYASNRGDNSITVFSISDRDGTLEVVQHMDSGGRIPRHFAIDPGNQWLLVANQDSSSIVVFARNQRTGLLTATGRQYPVDYPVCLVFR
ncbi:MAG: lactonase family protein [Acidobacteriaceae bacterium]